MKPIFDKYSGQITNGLPHLTHVRLQVTSTQHMKRNVCSICYVVYFIIDGKQLRAEKRIYCILRLYKREYCSQNFCLSPAYRELHCSQGVSYKSVSTQVARISHRDYSDHLIATGTVIFLCEHASLVVDHFFIKWGEQLVF